MKNFLIKLFGFNYYNDISVNLITRIISLFGAACIILMMNSVISWFAFSLYLRIFVNTMVIALSLYLFSIGQFKLTKSNILVAVCTLFLCIHLQMKGEYKNIFGYYQFFVNVLSVFFITLWSPKVLENVYKYLFRVIVVVSLISIFVTVSSVIGLLDYLPYYEMDPVEAVHERAFITYHVYGVVVTYHTPYNFFLIQRACGFLCEPGHYSLLLGIIWAIERVQRHKINWIILVCGFLTLSPNFAFIFIFTETWIIFVDQKYAKGVRNVTLALGLGVFVFFMLPQEVQDEVYYFALGRNLVGMWDVFSSTTSLDEAFNERVTTTGLEYFDRFLRSDDVMFGMNVENANYSLSDYRGLLLLTGVIGVLLVVFDSIFILSGLKFKQMVPFLFILVLILLHRAWMFTQIYQLLLIYLGTSIMRLHNRRRRLLTVSA